MSAKKIITNLYLGDRHSIPQDANLVIGCAAEIYREQIQKHNIKNDNQEFIWIDDQHIYFNFKDYPTLQELDVNVVIQALKIIDNNIKRHRVSEVQQINSERGWFFIEKKHYFILRSLVIKYGKDNVINTVNNIVINNVKEDE